ncbi:Uncharacterised protein [Bordetella pertussis]|nr:Uncharacterised protein [Bordetella pertussis]
MVDAGAQHRAGAAQQLLAGVFVARVAQVQAGAQARVAEAVRAADGEALQAGAPDVLDRAEVLGHLDQVLDAGLVIHHAQFAVLVLVFQADLGVARLFRLEVGVAAIAERAGRRVQIVERRRPKARVGGHGGAQVGRQVEPVGQAAGGVAAELRVVVVAQAGLHMVAAEIAQVDAGVRVHVAARLGVVADAGGGAHLAVGALVQVLVGQRQRLAGGQGEVVLPQVLHLAGPEARVVVFEHAFGARIVLVFHIAGAQRALPVAGQAVFAGQRIGLQVLDVAVVVVVRGRGVVAAVDAAAVDLRHHFLLGPPFVAQRAGGVVLVVAVLVRVVRERAAVGGVEAMALAIAGGQAVAEAVGRARDAGVVAAGAVGAVTGVGIGRQRLVARLAGNDVDHAADRVGPVQAAGRATHDLDAFDGFRRQRVERNAAAVGVVDALAVEQDQGLVAVGAAHEQAGDALRAAAVGEFDAVLLRQHFGQAGLAGARQRIALDHAGVGQHILEQLGRSRGGDDDRIEFGDGLAGGGAGLGVAGQRSDTGQDTGAAPE